MTYDPHHEIRKALAGNSEGDFEIACTWEAVRALLADRDALAAPQPTAAAPDVLAMRTALQRIARAGNDCGCRPCTGQCRNQESLEIALEGIKDAARAALSAQGEAKPEPRAAWFDVEDEVTITRAVSVLEDVLTDIDDWEDKALAEAVRESMRDLRAMVGTIGMAAASVATPEPQEGRKPISKEQRYALFNTANDESFTCMEDFYAGIDAAERFHGITQDGERDHG